MDRRAPVPEEFHLVPFIDEQPEGGARNRGEPEIAGPATDG